jgi:diguanylate cyclase (GGDEF)-like protein/PAS domain S-box-containing protein
MCNNAQPVPAPSVLISVGLEEDIMTTPANRTKILLIENDPTAADSIRAALTSTATGSFDVEWVRQLCEGLDRLSKREIAAVLLALTLPDSRGVESFDKLFAAAPDIPILILGGNVSEALAKEAVSHGAQDYLLPDHLDYLLPRALRNAIERKSVEDALYLERERAVVTLNSIGDAVLSTNISGHITYLNSVAETMTGWRNDEAVGKPLAEVFRIIDGATREVARNPLEMAVEQNRTVGLTMNCILVRRDGFEAAIEDSAAPIRDRSGKVIGAVIVFHDVTGARARSLQMTHLAQHDALTDLPNRVALGEHISHSISLAHRHRGYIAILFLDLDRFKDINDSHGHLTGDKLLKSISQRLLSIVRSSDTVCRLGGDEFVVLLSEIAHPKDAARCAEKILGSLKSPHSIEGNDLQVDCSIGISIYPTNGQDTDTLIKNADAAMYSAKTKGINKFQFFEKTMSQCKARTSTPTEFPSNLPA